MANNIPKGRYISGSAVRSQEWNDILRDEPRSRSHSVRRNREKASSTTVTSVLMLVVAIVGTSIMLIRYLGLQASVQTSIKNVSKMESELYTLTQENDEYETRINSSVDLGEIKRKAIMEMGMIYAQDGQIIEVSAGSDDYVRKYADIP